MQQPQQQQQQHIHLNTIILQQSWCAHKFKIKHNLQMNKKLKN